MFEQITPQINVTTEISPADRQAEITYITVPDGVKYDLPVKPWVLLDSKKVDTVTKYVFVKQPAYEDGLTIEYADLPEFEQIAKKMHVEMFENRQNKHDQSHRFTTNIFVKENSAGNLEIIDKDTQNINKHIFEFTTEIEENLKTKYQLTQADVDNLKQEYTVIDKAICIREFIKHQAPNLSQPLINRRADFYEICEGCTGSNHAESVTLTVMKNKGTLNLLQGATSLVGGHWWSCDYCQKGMKAVGINKLIISKNWAKNYLGVKEL